MSTRVTAGSDIRIKLWEWAAANPPRDLVWFAAPGPSNQFGSVPRQGFAREFIVGGSDIRRRLVASLSEWYTLSAYPDSGGQDKATIRVFDDFYADRIVEWAVEAERLTGVEITVVTGLVKA